MLKPLTLSLSLALALGFCGVSKAGPFHNHSEGGCSTCGMASAQGPVVSPQAPYASPQGECGPTCVGECGKKKCALLSHMKGMGGKMSCGFNGLCAKLKPKPHVYTYEWVLKKKKVKHHKGICGSPTCETCGVYPSGQGAPSPQGTYAAPQAGYGSPQAGYAAPQAFGTYGGSGQMATSMTTAAPAPMAGDEAPPAPEVAPAAPGVVPTAPMPTPAPPVPTAPRGTTSGLLFSTPSGN